MANQVFKYCTPTKKYARFQIQNYIFYTSYISNCIYLCMCDIQYEQRIAFLFLEDINEHPYRLERMFIQLLEAGFLAQQKAILLGDFSGYRLVDNDRGYDLATAIAWLRERLPNSIPILTGLPFGHCP